MESNSRSPNALMALMSHVAGDLNEDEMELFMDSLERSLEQAHQAECSRLQKDDEHQARCLRSAAEHAGTCVSLIMQKSRVDKKELNLIELYSFLGFEVSANFTTGTDTRKLQHAQASVSDAMQQLLHHNAPVDQDLFFQEQDPSIELEYRNDIQREREGIIRKIQRFFGYGD